MIYKFQFKINMKGGGPMKGIYELLDNSDCHTCFDNQSSTTLDHNKKKTPISLSRCLHSIDMDWGHLATNASLFCPLILYGVI